MKIRLAERLSRIQPSITLAVTDKAKAMRAKGVDIISFSAGEPDFDTPDFIKQRAIKALDEGVSKYPVTAGTPELRQAICKQVKEVHGLAVQPPQVLVSAGAKHSLFNFFLAVLDPGDEVIVPAPYWVSYPEQVRIAGGNPVTLPARPDLGFALDPAELEAAITDRTRAIIINSPSNPSGAVLSREVLEKIGEIAVSKDLLIVADDIYRLLVYGDARYTSIASLSPEIAERTVLIDGVSKSYAMTGWRIGWTVGPRELIAGMAKLQGQSTSGANHLAQVAATEAISGPQACVEEMRQAFDARRKRMVELLRAIDGVECNEPEGAFYAFPDLRAFIGKKTPAGTVLEDDVQLAEYLVEDGNVAVVPGSGFGAAGFARLSYACSMEDIEKGVRRVQKALSALA
jgi:aspartate aminotransferase